METPDQEGTLQDGSLDEIALMRMMIRRVFEYANEGARVLSSSLNYEESSIFEGITTREV